MTMGDKIHYLRNARKLTLQELGNKVGVGASTVRKWENGMIQSVSSKKIKALADALSTSVDYLMGWSDNSVGVNSVGTNNGVIGQNSGSISLEAPHSKEESELIRIFGKLDVKRRIELLATAIRLEEEQDK